jgi:hypothetical protein
MDARARPPNNLLAALSAADLELLRPRLHEVELIHETVLARAGDTLERVYFPSSGILSLVVTLEGGEAIEVAMVGLDSVYGAAAALGGSR